MFMFLSLNIKFKHQLLNVLLAYKGFQEVGGKRTLYIWFKATVEEKHIISIQIKYNRIKPNYYCIYVD